MNNLLAKLTILKDNLNKENGDTNFISILIVLGIVLLVATVFREQITKVVNAAKQAIDANLQFSI